MFNIDRPIRRAFGQAADVVVDAPQDAVFAVVAGFEQSDGWLTRVKPVVKSEPPVGLGTTVIVPIENFWGSPLGVVTALASLTRTGFGRVHGAMEVTEFEPGRSLALESTGTSMRIRLRFDLHPVSAGMRLTYREELPQFGRLRGLASIFLLPLTMPLYFAIVLLRPAFAWSARRRVSRIRDRL